MRQAVSLLFQETRAYFHSYEAALINTVALARCPDVNVLRKLFRMCLARRNVAKRMECVQLAAAFASPDSSET